METRAPGETTKVAGQTMKVAGETTKVGGELTEAVGTQAVVGNGEGNLCFEETGG